MIYTLNEIELMTFKSKSSVRSIIKSLGIKEIKVENKREYFYNIDQIELIKENNREYYEENLKKGVLVIF